MLPAADTASDCCDMWAISFKIEADQELYIRSAMSTERLSDLAMLSIENWWIFLRKKRHENEHFGIIRLQLLQTDTN